MTEPKPFYDVRQAEAEARQQLEDYLGVVAPKNGEPSRRCDAFDADACPWCDHYEECAASEIQESSWNGIDGSLDGPRRPQSGVSRPSGLP